MFFGSVMLVVTQTHVAALQVEQHGQGSVRFTAENILTLTHCRETEQNTQRDEGEHQGWTDPPRPTVYSWNEQQDRRRVRIILQKYKYCSWNLYKSTLQVGQIIFKKIKTEMSHINK